MSDFCSFFKLKMRTGGLQKPHRKGEGRRSRSESQLSESSQGEQATPQVPSATPLPGDTDQSLNTEDQGVVTTEEDNSATDTIRLEHVLTTQFIDQENPQESPGIENLTSWVVDTLNLYIFVF